MTSQAQCVRQRNKYTNPNGHTTAPASKPNNPAPKPSRPNTGNGVSVIVRSGDTISGIVALVAPALVQAFKKYIPADYVGLTSLGVSVRSASSASPSRLHVGESGVQRQAEQGQPQLIRMS